jgi:hypothetical protein
MLVAALVFWLVPPAVLLAGAAGLDLGRLAAPALAATGLAVLFWTLVSYGMKIPVIYGLGFPIGAVMALYIVARSTWRGSRRVEWRGRVYGTGSHPERSEGDIP